MRVRRLLILPLAVIWLLIGQNASGEFYQYRNEDGVICFTDDLSKVPEKDLENRKVYYDQYDAPRQQGGASLKEEEMTREEKENRNKASQTGSGSDPTATSFSFIENKILVQVTIGNNSRETKATLLLDTGASTTVIHESLARRLGLRNEFIGQASVAGGQVIETGITRADFISLGPKRLDTPSLTVIPFYGGNSRHEGLLGMDFLKHFPHTIDTKNRRILWAE